jgi:DNA-binding MurR/RpiR family transcriptional regulator
MEPITIAVIAALGKMSEAAIADGYQALKALLKSKFGEQSDIAVAAEKLEQDPQSQARKAVLDEEARKVEASKDDDLREAVDNLLTRLSEAGVKVEVTVRDQATAQGVIGAGNVNIENMSFGSPKKD